MAGKCDFHYLLSKKQGNSITPGPCFAQGYVKKALNTIALLQLAWGKTNTHTKTHGHTLVSGESGHCSSNATSNFLVPLFTTTCLNFSRTENVAEVSVCLRNGEVDHILTQLSLTTAATQTRRTYPDPFLKSNCSESVDVWNIYMCSLCLKMCT